MSNVLAAAGHFGLVVVVWGFIFTLIKLALSHAMSISYFAFSILLPHPAAGEGESEEVAGWGLSCIPCELTQHRGRVWNWRSHSVWNWRSHSASAAEEFWK